MNSTETERLAEVAAMRERTIRPQQDWSAVCQNCHLTLGEHKGSYCVTGPKHFRTIANTTYRGEHDMNTASKTTTTYAVVRHSSGQGFVVRTVSDGWLPAPYTHTQREMEVRYEKMAQKIADRFNNDPAMHPFPTQ